jgi:exosortase/archaeosortase family protein
LACSSDLLLAPFLLVVGGLLCVGRSSVRQVLTAAGLAVAIVVCMNVLRLVVIAAIVDRWGADLGVGRDHPLFGSVLTLLAMSVALVAYVFVLGRLSRFAVSGTEE